MLKIVARICICCIFVCVLRVECEQQQEEDAQLRRKADEVKPDSVVESTTPSQHDIQSQISPNNVEESNPPLEASSTWVSSHTDKVNGIFVEDNKQSSESVQNIKKTQAFKSDSTIPTTALEDSVNMIHKSGHQTDKDSEETGYKSHADEPPSDDGTGNHFPTITETGESHSSAPGDLSAEKTRQVTPSDVDPATLSGGSKVDTSGKVQSDHFQSYSEWRQKVLEEEQRSKQDNTASPNNQQSVLKPKVRINLSSNTCGAKVLASNQEAENVQGVLTSNKDDYMLNPCSAPKKWFVVELCEPVQVKTIEIASLELFSSQPKTFRMFLSDRFPAKEWHEKGEYQATEEKTAQVFQIDDQHFFKFVKVELIDHYGNEHFCPISLFRVYGVPMADDDDDDDDDNGGESAGAGAGASINKHPDIGHTEDEAAILQEGDESVVKENSRNLFMSAKDTVLNLVKKVLNVEEGEREAVPSDKRETSEMLFNTNFSIDGFLLPCVPGSDDKDKKTSRRTVRRITTPFPDTPTVAPTGKDFPIVTKLEDDEQIPSEPCEEDQLVILVASDVASPLEICEGGAQNKTNQTTTTPHRVICSYVQTMLSNKLEQTCSLLPGNTASPIESLQTTESHKANSLLKAQSNFTYLTADESEIQRVSEASMINSEETTKMIPSSPLASEHQSMSSSQSESSQSESSQSESRQESLRDKTTLDNAQSFLPEHVTASSTPLSEQNTEDGYTLLLKPSITSYFEETDSDLTQTPVLIARLPTRDKEVKTSDKSLHTIRMSPSPMAELGSNEGSLTAEMASTVNIMDVEEDVTKGFKVEQAESSDPELAEQISKDSENETGVKDKGLDLIHVPLAPMAKRETAIMRLTNRIKALELNVSLSSRFLDELSHRFKKQSEDMMKLLNKTIAHFTNVTSRAEERDTLQQEQLNKLESRVENLTLLMSELSVGMEELNSKITDRQVVWTTVEFVLLVIVCVVCLRRGTTTNLHPEIQQMLDMMPKNPQLFRTRRNSVGTVGHIVPATPIKKQASDSALAAAACTDSSSNFEIVEQRSFLLTQQPSQKDGSKKKKKRKHKNLESKSSSDAVCEEPENISSTKLTESAGLLFGADAVSVLTGATTSTTTSPQMNSSPHKTSSKSLPTHSRHSSQTSIEIQKDLPKSLPTKKFFPSIPKQSPRNMFGLLFSNISTQSVQDNKTEESKRWGTSSIQHVNIQPGNLTNGSMTECNSFLIRKPPDSRNKSIMKEQKTVQAKKGWIFRKSSGFE